VEALNGKEVKGKELFASRAQKKQERSAALKAKFDEVGLGCWLTAGFQLT
jgi:hypothetical protein